MFGYLSRLSNGMKILWCYLIWYLYFGLEYFESDLELWRRSLGIALLVGLALNINAFCSFKGIINASNKWQILRFFVIPFCVSSFPVLIKDKGFLLFFSPSLKENLIALSLCMLFLSLTWISKLVTHEQAVCRAEE
ncbi:MAG: hypothetical protein ISS59_02730 [Desulfobacteraceae bacterium]|nr:hypothetical protein [Desulfobacteraceae bacterium]